MAGTVGGRYKPARFWDHFRLSFDNIDDALVSVEVLALVDATVDWLLLLLLLGGATSLAVVGVVEATALVSIAARFGNDSLVCEDGALLVVFIEVAAPVAVSCCCDDGEVSSSSFRLFDISRFL
jgi:hypothetical protein